MGFWGISTGAVLVVLTFARVYYIVWMLIFPLFVLPCYYMPNCCPCRRFFTEDNSEEIWDLLLQSQWLYNEAAHLSHTLKPTCLLCLQAF